MAAKIHEMPNAVRLNAAVREVGYEPQTPWQSVKRGNPRYECYAKDMRGTGTILSMYAKSTRAGPKWTIQAYAFCDERILDLAENA